MNHAPATDSPTPASSDVAQLRELLREHRFSEVLTGANAVLAAAPGQRDALLFAAIAQRFLGQIPEALKTIATLEQASPEFQPYLRGARPLLRRIAPGTTSDRGLPSGCTHQSRRCRVAGGCSKVCTACRRSCQRGYGCQSSGHAARTTARSGRRNGTCSRTAMWRRRRRLSGGTCSSTVTMWKPCACWPDRHLAQDLLRRAGTTGRTA